MRKRLIELKRTTAAASALHQGRLIKPVREAQHRLPLSRPGVTQKIITGGAFFFLSRESAVAYPRYVSRVVWNVELIVFAEEAITVCLLVCVT